MTDQAHLRRWARPIVPAAAGVPLIKSTHDLQLRLTWLDGSHSCDWDFDEKHLSKFLLAAILKLANWKQKEGYLFHNAPNSWTPPDNTWRRFPGKAFWWLGPVEAIVLGGLISRGDEGERDFDGTKGPWLTAREMRSGEQHLNDTGGKIAYRVGAYFTVKQHLAEVAVKPKEGD